ncbi:MAG: thioredoxin family protein [Bacteroidota bacterium]
MKKKAHLFWLGLVALLVSCSGSKSTVEAPAKGVRFEKAEALSDVLEKAEKKGKLVFVDLYTTWCVPCKVMDEEVFTDQAVMEVLNNNFLSYKVDAEKGNGTNLAFVFQSQVYPTLLFLDHRGKVIERNDGALAQSQLIEMANRVFVTATDDRQACVGGGRQVEIESSRRTDGGGEERR